MEKKIIKHLVTTYVNKKFRNPEKQRNFLIDCIQSHGYIVKKNVDQELEEQEESFEDLYQYMIPVSNFNQVSNFPDLKLSIQEQSQTSVDPYGFNRTFIHADSHSADKLNLLQKRGITYDEIKFIQVKEKMEEIINKSLQHQEMFDKILQTALNIYLNILIAYKDNPFGFTDIKGSLKNGYIFLCVYYALLYNNVYIDRRTLIEKSESTRLSDLPIADKNIKIIFKGVPGFSFIFNNYKFNPKNVFANTLNISSQELLSKIENVIETTSHLVPSTKLGIYSVVYFVCNDYYPFKVKILFNKKETKVTYQVLNEIFEPFSSSTVRKITDKLRQFFKSDAF